MQYIKTIDELQSKVKELEKTIRGLTDDLTRSSLSQENCLRMHQKSQIEIGYYNEFVAKIKALVYKTEVSEVTNVCVGSLDTIYASLFDTFNELSKKADQSEDLDEVLEKTKLKDLLNDFSDKYSKVVEKKNQLIDSLQQQLDAIQKDKKMSINILETEEYKRLLELKNKDQESYEGEVKALKQSIVEKDNQKEKDNNLISRLKTDNVKFYKQIKQLTADAQEKQQDNSELESEKSKNVELTSQLEQTKKELDSSRQELEQSRKEESKKSMDEEKIVTQKKNEGIINELQKELEEQKKANQELSKKFEQMREGGKEITNNTMKNLIKAFNLIKKSKKILDIMKTHGKVKTESKDAEMEEEKMKEKKVPIKIEKPKGPILRSQIPKPKAPIKVTNPVTKSVMKPSPSIIKKKRTAKEVSKQSESDQEDSQGKNSPKNANKMPKTS
jgi:hypothetical protein